MNLNNRQPEIHLIGVNSFNITQEAKAVHT
jgi:hypothetical protein